MTTIAEYKGLHIPTWALGYLVNDNVEGLTSGEIATINKWALSFEPLDPHADFLVSTESEEYFSHSPEFGLPCTCVDGTVQILQRD